MVDNSVVYAKAHKKEFLQMMFSYSDKPRRKAAIFMAGTPGAGKTEMVQSLSQVFGPSYALIDADRFRSQFRTYNGKNAEDFQRGSSLLVDYTFTEVVSKGYSFILDGTFSRPKSMQNVERVLNRGYKADIYFVHQSPEDAWRFTKVRAEEEGRVVPKQAFISSYVHARENVHTIKERFKTQVMLNIVFKDYTNTVTDFVEDAESLEDILPPKVSEKEIEVLIND
ncbi:zeta toxin family protein [Fructobacillus sp. W13]|uniref:UDP-N-acetylglucosamine kinase n=1 Tax=Fructobacillus apis TaxID=2935017 RepID=A0ABT0ZRF9_9LACO|nr:zeta toxin family protein [Fructobacillus apis]MCO0832581.1 zeta toxin family protein [Fructobacillus apis]